MFGISLYFQDLDFNYIKKAHHFGAKTIFTSLHIPEENFKNFHKHFKEVLDLCHKLNMDLVFDISPHTYEKLNLENGDYKALKNLGIETLRLDFGFEDINHIKVLSENFKLYMNASVIDQDYLDRAQDIGIDLSKIILSHNFYPKKDSGLSTESFIKRNFKFKKSNRPIQAFICGDKLKRFPMYEGLPTLEIHRDMKPFVSAVDLVRNFGIKEVLIGDSLGSDFLLEALSDFFLNDILTIPVHFHEDFNEFYDKILFSREDTSEYSIRIKDTRKENIEMNNSIKRKKGSITMDNKHYGRYSGELSLIKTDLEMDHRVNVIGFVSPGYIRLLDYVKDYEKIKFIPIKNEF